MKKAQTDNTYFKHKIKLRLDNLPNKKNINILDCYYGDGLIWNEIKIKSNKNIKIISIDRKKESNALLIGDNIKYLKGMDLNKYDIIDLDAYGIPYDQIKIILEKQFKGVIFVTFIQSIFGRLPKKMLFDLGYNKKMIEKCPTLFEKNGIEKLLKILYNYNIESISGFFIGRKNYFKINLGEKK